MPPPPDPSPGALLAGRFRLERLLGRGGMGVVWAVTEVGSGEALALKLLTDERAGEPAARRRFLREARAAMALRHPHVVAVREVVELEGGAPGIVMALLRGETLSAKLDREGPLSVAETARLLVPVVSAVGAAHALGIVHRDLKPENIFLAEPAEPAECPGLAGEHAPGTCPTVLDFGIAKLTWAASASQQPQPLTTTGAILGTPSYMAPEQASGEGDVDHRADVWALGLILYQCLSGLLPTAGENLGQVFKAILTRRIPPLVEAAPDVPTDVAALVDRMLSRARSSRPRDLREVLETLARHAGAEAPGAPGAPSFGPSTVPLGDLAPQPRAMPRDDAPLDEEVSPTDPTVPSVPSVPRRARVAAVPSLPMAARPRGGLDARARRWSPWLAGGVRLAALVSTVLATRPALRRLPQPSPPVAPASSASARVGFLDAPKPVSSSPRALELYRAALGELRDAALARYQDKLEEALNLDPDLAAAHVRVALLSGPMTTEATREHLERARARRESLTPRDLDLLRLIDLDLAGNDPVATVREAVAIAAARPGDAELRWVVSALAFDFGDLHEAHAQARALVELDGRAAIGQWVLGLAASGLGDDDEVRRATAKCSELSPATSACRALASVVARTAGRCAELDEHARQLVSMEGQPARRFDARLDALMDRSPPASRGVALELLEQKWARLEPAARPLVEAQDRARLELVLGDFVAAARDAQAATALADRSTNLRAHAEAARLSREAAGEAGDDEAERRALLSFAARHRAWTYQPPRLDVLGAAGDDTLPLLAGARRAGAVSDADYAATRTEWLSAIKSAPAQALLWQLAYALPAATEPDAREALAARGAFAPWTSLYLPPRAVLAAEGRVHLLAGDVTGAIPLLRRGAASCVAWSDPVQHVRAHRDLGLALERNGDTAGACAAYAIVLARWGAARPRSVTADDARRGMKRLGCAAPRAAK